MSSKDNFVFESSFIEGSLVAKLKVTASRKVTLYELAEALYDYYINLKDTTIFFDIEYYSCDGKMKYHLTNNAYWMNPATVLGDIACQIKI
mgnify:FL=1